MSVTCLICSVDSFSDVWPAALECLSRYWADCPYVVRTMSGVKPWGKNPLLTGPEDRGWVGNLTFALDQIDSEFVLMWLDDMILCREVNTFDLELCVIAMQNYPMCGAIRVGQGSEEVEILEPDWAFASPPNLMRIKRDSRYRVSTSPTIWHIDFLRKILKECGSTAWDFEMKGTRLSQEFPHEVWVIHGLNDSLRPFRCYYTAITRNADGKSCWNRGALDWLKSIGIEVADTSRGINEETTRNPF